MYPHERSLVKKHQNEPFVILGVNSDSDRAVLKERMEEESITWRSWFDGGGTGGPIANAWNVTGWPTTYVIDAEGVIRYKQVRGEGLDTAIADLLTECREKEGREEVR